MVESLFSGSSLLWLHGRLIYSIIQSTYFKYEALYSLNVRFRSPKHHPYFIHRAEIPVTPLLVPHQHNIKSRGISHPNNTNIQIRTPQMHTYILLHTPHPPPPNLATVRPDLLSGYEILRKALICHILPLPALPPTQLFLLVHSCVSDYGDGWGDFE